MRWSLTQLGLLAFSRYVPALLVAADPLHQVIDHHIGGAAGGPVAPTASDAEFLRRVTLDLAGRVPTIKEKRAFPENVDAEKRGDALDRQIDSQADEGWKAEV